MVVNEEWYNDDPGGGGLHPENPDSLNDYKDKTYTLLLKGRTDQLQKTRPKIIYEILNNNQGPRPINKINSCVRLRSGDYLINIDLCEKEKVMKMNKLSDIPVLFQEAWDINNTKVSIMDEDLTNYPANNQNNCNEELLHDLKSQNPQLNIKNAEIQSFWDKIKKKNVSTHDLQ